MATAPVKIEVIGLRELQREMRAIDDGKWKREIGKASKAAAKDTLVPVMRRRAPKRSGRLARSIRALGSTLSTKIAVGNNTSVPYARPINFGWPLRNIKAQEFVYSTIQQETEKFLEEYWGAIDRVVHRAFPRGRLKR